MMKYVFLFCALFIYSLISSQTFDTIYRSFRPEHLTVDEIHSCIELKSKELIFISFANSTDSSYYRYLFGTKIDSNGKILLSKPIHDSINFILPSGSTLYSNSKIIIYGSIRHQDIKKSNYWYGIYDLDLNLLEEHEYETEYDGPKFLGLEIAKNGDLVFCGWNLKYNNRGNGGPELAKASVICIDNMGKKKWQFEFWDAQKPPETHQFTDIIQDSLGNFYTCGFRTRTDFTGAGIIAKIDKDGKLIWYKQYNPIGYSEVFVNLKILSNSQLCILGTDSNPDRLTTDQWYEIYYSVMDSSGIIRSAKRMSRLYNMSIYNCVTTPDNNYVCAGVIRESIDMPIEGFMVKISSAGNVIWRNKIEHNSKSNNVFYNVTNSLDRGYYFYGYSHIPGIRYSQNWLVKTDSNGCAINNCINTGTEGPYNSEKEFSIYPNPAQDYIVIKNADPYTSTFLIFELYDLNGKMILRSALRSEITQLNVQNINRGLYLYRIRDGLKKVQEGMIIIN